MQYATPNELKEFLIEPMWNWNLIVPTDYQAKQEFFNWTNVELKPFRRVGDSAGERFFNWTNVELKPRIGRVVSSRAKSRF